MKTLGKYKILGTLGAGAFGTVYHGLDPVLQREVAIKVLQPQWSRDAGILERFRREAIAMARLRHPNIVMVHEFDQLDGMAAFVMEYVPGTTLAKVIPSGGMTLRQAMPMIEKLIDALMAAHAQNILHRDIKPANILVEQATSRPVLTDFGLAKLHDLSSMNTGSLGTPLYMAPELWEEGEASAGSDVYALSCVMAEMLTGKALFMAKNGPMVMKKHVTDGARLDDIADRRLREALMVGLAKQASQRASLANLLAGLKAVVGGGAVPVVSPVAVPNNALRNVAQYVGELIRIPAGNFIYGDDKKTRHLPDYYIGKYPVTTAQFWAFVKATGFNGHSHWASGNEAWLKSHSDYPAVYLSWDDANVFCAWASQMTGLGICLPSEVEWEKAARGTDGRTYPWGEAAPDVSRANYDKSYDLKNLSRVGSYPAGNSPYGCADMAGNVWEWCSEIYEGTSGRVLRGGSFFNNAGDVRCAFRNFNFPSSHYLYYGFRGSFARLPSL